MFDDQNNTNDPAKEDNPAQDNNHDQHNRVDDKKEPDKSVEPAPVTNISTPPVSAPLNTPKKTPESSEKIEDMFAGSEPEGEGKPDVFQPKETQESTGKKKSPKGLAGRK
jgi:hypothetical protein